MRHELRLLWRGSGRSSTLVLGGLGLVFWAGLHFSAWGLLQVRSPQALHALTPLLGAGVWLAASLMLSQAILLSVRALFDRGDLDLLLSSPLDVRTVFTVRALGIAATCSSLPLFLASPFADMGLALGQVRLLAIYPAIAALALLATALGMLATLSLVRWVGARRARVAAQLLGAFTGAAVFLLGRAGTWLDAGARRQWAVWLMQATQPAGALGPDSMAWLPFQAAQGQAGPLALMMVLGVGSFAAVVRLTHHRFLAGTQESVTSPRRSAVAAGALRFRGGLARVVLVKEWKLILRDTHLLGQTLMQLLYLAPLLLLFMRQQPALTALVPMLVVLSVSLASTLAWLTVSAEDAPELIGTAPVDAARVRWLKVLAAVVPVWLLLSPVLVALLLRNLHAAMALGLCLVGGCICAGLTQIGYPRRADRRDLARRAQSGKLVAVLEGVNGLAWGGTAYAVLAAPSLVPAGLLAAAAGPAIAWQLGEPLRRQGMPV